MEKDDPEPKKSSKSVDKSKKDKLDNEKSKKDGEKNGDASATPKLFPPGCIFEASQDYFKEFDEDSIELEKLVRKLDKVSLKSRLRTRNTTVGESETENLTGSEFKPAESESSLSIKDADAEEPDIKLNIDTTQISTKIVGKLLFLERFKTNGRHLRRIRRLLESSIELSNLILANLPAQEHSIGLNGNMITKVQKSLSSERTDLNQVTKLKTLNEVADFPTKFDKKLSSKFWEGFFIHWRHCADTSLLQNEWTALIRSSGSFAQFYIDLFCPATLQIFYDGSKLFAAQEKKRRPDICIQMQNKPYIVALYEVATDFLKEDMAHKDDVKLFKCMRRALDEQLETLLTSDTGVFGILQGERRLCAFFMRAIEDAENVLRFPISLLTPTLIDLNSVEGCFAYYNLLCMIEYRAKFLKDARTLAKNDLVLPPLQLERGRKTHGSTTPSKPAKTSKKSIEKKDDGNNRSSTNVNKLELQLSELLYGRLSAIHVGSNAQRTLKTARYYMGNTWSEVALVTKHASDDREIHFLKSFKCDKIVRYFESCIDKRESGSTYILVLEKLAPIPKIRNAANFLSFCQDVIEGLAYLHDNNIVHRDIKPSNIGYHREEKAYKLFDFNIAVRLQESSNYKSFTPDVGTEGYQAPEVICIDPKKGYDTKADIYSLGVTIKELNRRVRAPVGDIVAKCMLKNPEERPTARDLLTAVTQLMQVHDGQREK